MDQKEASLLEFVSNWSVERIATAGYFCFVFNYRYYFSQNNQIYKKDNTYISQLVTDQVRFCGRQCTTGALQCLSPSERGQFTVPVYVGSAC